MKTIQIILLILLTAILAPSQVAADVGSRTSVAIISDNQPVIELRRNSNGSLRFELNQDLMLGMSLGINPTGVANPLQVAPGDRRWHPVFDLLASPPRKSGFLLPEYKSLPSRQTRWFLTFGSHSKRNYEDPFNFQDDLSRHFSLQSKAGFVVPIGKRVVVGGAITLNYDLDDGDLHRYRGDSTSTGAYLGLKVYY